MGKIYYCNRCGYISRKPKCEKCGSSLTIGIREPEYD